MTPETAIELKRAVVRCAQHLKNRCIRDVGVIHVTATDADKISFFAPAMVSGLAIEDVQLDDLTRALYMGEPVTPDEIIDAWEVAACNVNGHKSCAKIARAALATVHPYLPYRHPPGGDIRAEMTQFLLASSWHVGRLKFDSGAVTWRHRGVRLGIDTRWVDSIEGSRRMHRPLNFRLQDSVKMSLGRANRATVRAGAVYRHLMQSIPSMAPQIAALFQVVTHAGEDFSDMVTEAFDVVVRRDVEVTKVFAFERALSIIELARSYPFDLLSELLIPVIGKPEFNRQFGPKYGTGTYIPARRAAHRAAVVALQASRIKKAKIDAGDTVGGEALALLELQQTIGRR